VARRVEIEFVGDRLAGARLVAKHELRQMQRKRLLAQTGFTV